MGRWLIRMALILRPPDDNFHLEERSFFFDSVGMVRIKQRRNHLGGVVWRCSQLMGTLLCQYYRTLLRGKRIVELGSGSGLLGIVAALLGGDVVLTDVPELVPLLEDNVVVNQEAINTHGGHVRCVPLEWSCSLPPELQDGADFVLCSDCIYNNVSSYVPLLRTLSKLLMRPNSCCILGSVFPTNLSLSNFVQKFYSISRAGGYFFLSAKTGLSCRRRSTNAGRSFQ